MIKILTDGLNKREEIFAVLDIKKDVSGPVKEILSAVKESGDSALIKYTEKFDGVKLTSLKVSKAEIEKALKIVESDFIEVLKRASKNIRAFHEKQKRVGFEIKENGKVVGQKIMPVEVA
ncbi:MAG: histidinol dehydrogenase, partial [Clostridia bacterium]|nr:histidinol dehydrogenase [Clostridia bacterium]